MDPATIASIMSVIGKVQKSGLPQGSAKKISNFSQPLLSLTGGALSSYGQSENDVPAAIAGGAIRGVGAGMSAGPIAALFSGLVGAGTEGVSTLNRIEQEQMMDESRTLEELYSSGALKGGGYSNDNNEQTNISPWQLEKGEMVITDDNSIYESHAKLSHEEMDPKELTDFLEDTTYVLPVRHMIEMEELKEVMGYSIGHYDEGARNFSVEPISLSDYVGDDPISYADAAKKIEKKIEVKGGTPGANILDDRTDKENLKTRAPILQKLKQLNEKRLGEELVGDNEITAVGMMQGGGDPILRMLINMPPGARLAVLASMMAQNAGATAGIMTGAGAATINTPAPPLEEQNIYDATRDRLSNAEFNALDDARISRDRLSDTINSIGSNNASSLATSMASLMFQDTKVRPKLRRPYLQEERFRGMSPQEIQAISQNLIGDGATLIKSLRDGGNNSMTANLAPILYSRLLSQSQDAQERLAIRNQELNTAKYNEVADIRTANDIEEVTADQATTDNVNQAISAASNIYGNYQNRKNNLAQARFSANQQIDRETNNTLNRIGSQRTNLDMLEQQNALTREELEVRKKALEAELERMKNEE
jgi:hypothetical protein